MSTGKQLRALHTWVNRQLDESADQWQTSQSIARFHFWMPLVLSAAVLAAKVHQPTYHLLIQEDGMLEWGTFLLAAIGACAAGYITVFRWRDGHRAQATMFGLLMLALVFLAGEEISWGQRVFGFETPDSLQEVNKKSEANLHNIGRFLSWTPFITLVAGLLGTCAWVANKRIRIERVIDGGGKFFIPPFFLCTSFLIVLLFSIAQFTLLPLTNTQSTRFAEVSEFCLTYGCGLFMWLVASRMRTWSTEPAAEVVTMPNSSGSAPDAPTGSAKRASQA